MNSIKKNFLFNASYQLANILLPLVTAPYIARVLGAERLGMYTYTFTWAGYFLMFAMLGFHFHGNRQVAKVRDNRQELSSVFSEIYCFQLTVSSAVVVIYVLFTLFFAEKELRLLLLIQTLHVASAMIDVSWLFFGIENFKTTTIRNFTAKLLTIAAMFVFVKEPGDLNLYAWIMAGGTFLSQTVLWVGVPKIVDLRKENWKLKTEHLKRSVALFIPVVAVSVYSMMDKLMVGRIAGMAELAFYENAHKVISAPIGLITAFEAVMLPRMVHLAARGEKQSVNKLLEESFLLVGMVAAPMMFGLAGIASPLTELMFGAEYLKSGQIMAVLAVTIPIVSWAGVIRKEILVPQNYDRIYIVSVFVGAFTNLLLNMVFIPRYGSLGAAWATVAAELSVCLYQTVKTRTMQPYGKYVANIAPFCVSAGIMGAAVYSLRRVMPVAAWSVALLVLFGIAVYFVLFVVCLKVTGKSLKDSLLLK